MDSFLEGEFPRLKAIRRELHSNPELSLDESWTAKFVADRLREYGVTTFEHVGGNGVVGVIEGIGPGPAVALRADMDALEIAEATGVSYASRNPGCMHACGHDGHMAILIGAGANLARRRDFRGTVHLFFQPAEEKFGGAQMMIDDGLLERFPTRQIFGLHNWPDLPEGDLAVHDGPVMAGARDFNISFHAAGGHAGMLHVTGDPVLAGRYFVTSLQQAVTRAINPYDSAVATVAGFQGGNTHNIIPDVSRLSGTLRAFNDETLGLLRERLEIIAAAAAEVASCSVEITYEDFVMPPVANTTVERNLMREAAAQIGILKCNGHMLPSMAGDDFGVFLKHLPGAYAWIGNGMGSGSDTRLHQPRYDFNDNIIVNAARLLSKTALLALAANEGGPCTNVPDLVG